jgi:hypothetical protein
MLHGSFVRDSHTPRSITTVRLLLSSTTVAWICRANTLMDVSVPRCGSALKPTVAGADQADQAYQAETCLHPTTIFTVVVESAIRES